MNWEGWGVIIALLGVAGTGVASIIAAFKITSKLSFFSGQFFTRFDQFGKTFTEFKEDFEKHMEEEKRQYDVVWKKIDGHGDKIIEHDQRIFHVEKSVEKMG